MNKERKQSLLGPILLYLKAYQSCSLLKIGYGCFISLLLKYNFNISSSYVFVLLLLFNSCVLLKCPLTGVMPYSSVYLWQQIRI